MMTTLTLASGGKLEITPAPFPDAKKLYAAIMGELKGVDVRSTTELDVNFIKNVMCSMIDSVRVEAALEVCLRRCTYNGEKIVADTWEPIGARGDYLDVCSEVVKENIAPFTKGLSAQFAGIFSALEKLQQ